MLCYTQIRYRDKALKVYSYLKRTEYNHYKNTSNSYIPIILKYFLNMLNIYFGKFKA